MKRVMQQSMKCVLQQSMKEYSAQPLNEDVLRQSMNAYTDHNECKFRPSMMCTPTINERALRQSMKRVF
eukprot:1563482-Pyramimonas_sp.AAC.1